MSLDESFNPASRPNSASKPKRLAPFSLRLSPAERARLLSEAKGAPLGGYIKAKLLGTVPVRMRRSGLAVEDRKALAQVLALLSSSRLASNLNQLAHAANIGALLVTTETEADLRAAVAEVRELRRPRSLKLRGAHHDPQSLPARRRAGFGRPSNAHRR